MLKASVIVPVYNVEKYLRRCVDSILAQTMPDFELILIDDGSTDGSPIICDEYAAKDSRVKVIHKQNQGVSAARNDGLDAAKGEYILFVDSDDYVDKEYIEQLTSNNCDLIVCGTKCIQGDEVFYYFPLVTSQRAEHVTFQRIGEWFDNSLLNSVWAKSFKRSIINRFGVRFNIELSYGEDTLFVLEYICRCSTVFFLDCAFYWYIKQSDGTLSTRLDVDSVKSFDLLYRKLSDWFSSQNITSTRFKSGVYLWKLKKSFFDVYESAYFSLSEKYKWYRLFFSLPTFNSNIDTMFAEYPKKLKAILYTKSAAALVTFQIMANVARKFIQGSIHMNRR